MIRLARFAVVLGVALIAASMIQGTIVRGEMIVLSEGEYMWFMVKASEDLHVEVTSGEDRRFSMHLLNFNDSMRFLEEGSLANCTRVSSYEGIQAFAGIVRIPTPGYYSLVFEAFEGAMTVSLNIWIGRAIPHLAVILIGATIVVPGGLILLRTRAQEKRRTTVPSSVSPV